MTAAMERHHGGAVALRVVAHDGPHRGLAGQEWYAREILLSGPSGHVVQYGIVRIDLSALSPADAVRVRGAAVPLGRILMAAGVLCDVHEVALLAVVPGPELAALIGEIPTFGRVATIRVNGQPAIELLEIVVDSGER
jgi:chorismate-pyruvate lyase